MSQSAAPWLAGLDGTSTWNSNPFVLPPTRPTSVTHEASSLIKSSTRSQRRSLSGNSVNTMKKARSPLAPLPMNENMRRDSDSCLGESGPMDAHGTVQQRSKSSSPAKKVASLEWRKRLLHGKVAYGDQTDLFGPSGLDNIFASSDKHSDGARRRKEKSFDVIPRSDTVLPSSPPPWPLKTMEEPNNMTEGSLQESSLDIQPAEDIPQDQPNIVVNSPQSSTRSNPFDLEITDPEIVPSRQASNAHVNQTLGAVTELEQEEFSPVFVSKHTTITGKVDYATVSAGSLKKLGNFRHEKEQQVESDVQDLSAESLVDLQPADDSVFTDGPESRLQPGAAQDLSLSENLPTGTPEPFGRFIEIERGGYSAIGSFRHRPLSLEASVVSEDHTDAIPPAAPTPPQVVAQEHATARSKPDAPSTPLKLFAAHDTFTSNRLLHRMIKLDEPIDVLADEELVSSVKQIRIKQPRQVSFGDGKLDNARFNASKKVSSPPLSAASPASDVEVPGSRNRAASPPSSAASPASDIEVPGSRMPMAFRRDPSQETSPGQAMFNAHSIGKRLRESQSSQVAGVDTTKTRAEHKRSPVSPLKHSTPKRRRTLHASEQLEGVPVLTAPASDVLQKHALGDSLQEPEDPTPAQGANIDASLKEATDHFLANEDPSIVDEVLDQIEQSLSDADAATIKTRAEAVASEIAKFTLKVNKAQQQNVVGDRKPSVTTQDFFREAECVMEYIRARAAKKKSLLSSVEETEQAEDEDEPEPEHSILMVKGSSRLDPHMRISREPSWEDRPRSRWREPEQQRMQRDDVNMNRVASQLRRWQEPDVIEEQDVFLEESEVSSPLKDEGNHSSEVVYDERAQIRITGPSSEYKHQEGDGFDSRPSSQRSAQSSNETTRKTENVGTLAPSAVAHLIGSEVGGMTFDKDKQRWVRTRSPEHKVNNGFLDVHESHMTSEDDPFREISDLDVDEGSEKRRTSSPARLVEPLHVPFCHDKIVNTRPVSFHALRPTEQPPSGTISRQQEPRSPTRTSTSETIVRQTDESNAAPSTARTVLEFVSQPTTLIAADERVTKVIDDAEAAVEAERDLVLAQRITHGTTTSAPELDFLSRLEEDSMLELTTNITHAAQSQQPRKKSFLPNETSIPVLPRPAYNQNVLEHSEVSFVAPLPGDRMISVSLSVSKPAGVPAHQVGRMLGADSSPLRQMSTMMLSDLPDFTVHENDSEQASEKAMAKRFAHYAAAEAQDRFALVKEELVTALTDNHPEELYWEELERLDIHNCGLTTLHGLDMYCNSVRALNVVSNKLTNLEGVPSSVQELVARKNQLSELTQFAHLHNLQYADVSSNDLESLDAIAACTHLRELRADDNHVSEVGRLGRIGLLALRCRRNRLRKLDFVAGDFSRLREMDLSSNTIESVDGIEHLSRLESLRLDNNPLKAGFTISMDMPRLKHLSLRNCGLTHLDVTRMPSLETLELDDNKLSTVHGVETLHHLQVLSLQRQSLPEKTYVNVLGKPLDAHTIRLSGNVLTQLSMESTFPSLRSLELSATGLSELPTNMGSAMPGLRFLNLNSNNIKDIRPLLHMELLQELRLCGNRLTRLRKTAAVLDHLPALRHVDLRDNPITQSFYSTAPPCNIYDIVRLNCDDQDDDKRQHDLERQAYLTAPSDAGHDLKHLTRLDEDTKLRRRVYEMLLAHSCKQLLTLDGLAFSKKNVLLKDNVWDRLLDLGVVRKSTGVVA